MQARKQRRASLGVESLETRAMLATLTVDIGDPTADEPGDNLYAEIQEAVDAASPGDNIRVHAGTYHPFVVSTDNLTIREAHKNSNPVVDGDLHDGDENGVEVNANGVTIRGLTAINASGSFFSTNGDGFRVTGDNNRLTDNVASGNRRRGFILSSSDGNTLKGNSATGNSRRGFVLIESDDNMLVGNTASSNGRAGFVLNDSDGNMLVGNTASSNGRNGFRVFLSHNNSFKVNTSNGNRAIGFWPAPQNLIHML